MEGKGIVLSLDRTKIVALMAGTATVGALLLMAGLLIGIGLRLPDHGRLAEDHARQPARAAIVPSRIAESSIPCHNVPISISIAGEPETGPRPAPATTAFSTEISQSAQSIAPTTHAGERLVVGEPALEPIDHSPRGEVLPPPDPSATQAVAFAVQVGAFLLEREAEILVDDLQGKGYSPQIAQFWAMRNSRKRLWYAVRIGGYADRGQAAHAAADFTHKEGQHAIVRPVGSL
jgi:cell division septation protein DedD